MKIIEQSYEILELSDLKLIELAGRNCYRSENKITKDSAPKFAKRIKEKKHGSILEFSNLTVRFITNRSVCYDDQTEVLTKDGWKFFKETTDNDEFFTTNLNTLNVEYQKRIGYTEEDWNGNMVYGESTMVNFGITPNHRMLWYHYDSRKEKNWKISPAEDVYNRRVKFQRGLFKEWKGNTIIEEFPLQATSAFAKFMGIFITDGWIYKHKNNGSGSKVGISQTKNFGCEFIEKVLNDLGWYFSYKNKEYIIQVPNLYKFLLKYFPEKPRKQNCRVPMWIRQAPTNYINSFLEGVIIGDGNIHNNGHSVIYGSNYKLMGDFQECVLKIGLCSTLRKDDRRGTERVVNEQTIKNILISYVLSITNRTNEHLFNKKHWELRHYKGKVRCVSVPNETLYVRRNGKAFWCCNTHEMVRHRIGMSYAQESQRYVRYDGKMEFIRPVWWETSTERQKRNWEQAIEMAEQYYMNLLNSGWRPEQAREVLPNSTKTEIIVKGNFRSWLHFFHLRCAKKAHPQIRHLAVGLLQEIEEKVPVVFDDIPGISKMTGRKDGE